MKKIIVLVFTYFLFVFSLKNAHAASCLYDEQLELNNAAASVKLDYSEKRELVQEEVEGETEAAYRLYFNVNILNITDKIYVSVYNSVDKSTKIFNSSNTSNGVASFDWEGIDELTELTIKVYANSNTGCPNTELLTITKVLPMYNIYSQDPFCEKYPDEKVCQKYTSAEISYTEFEKVVAKYDKKEEQERKELEKDQKNWLSKFIKNNKVLLIGIGSAMLVAGVVTTAVIIKKRRSRSI